eukprot:TRINITY_DN757_c0_g1_i3.p1 TRINITY_DN757_c0_g1~~TRINITY_DN757_c0_g1_i3.p1  ORF type:complete len:548 (-),score=108.23 TRINITY_DN757_c0_g1_i3:326-1969(-)
MSSKRVIRVGGVPEHFNYAWHMAIEAKLFENKDFEVQFIHYKEGTGAMITALKKGDVDMIIALTEGLVADIAKGSTLRLLGTYVESPLCWAISVGANSSYQTVEDLRGQTFGISRYGSGSHLMSFVLASQRGWNPQKDVSFNPVGDFKSLRDSVNSESSAAFLWETFTTKPFHDSGEIRRVGDVTTPWPCFMLASRKEVVDEKESDFKDMLDIIRDSCVQFHKTPEMHKQISKRYELKEEDALKWYSDVKITASSFISETALKRTLEALRETGVITAEIADSTLLHNLLDERIASVRKDIKSVKLYQKPELVTYIYNELRHIGKDKGPLGFEEVLPFDQHHYFELDGSEACASAIQLSSGQNVINFGSGLGGVPRYYAGKYGAQVLAVEVQDDLHTTASEITTRCGMSNKVHHLAGDFLLVSKHLRLNFYDSIVSWLTVLHIPQRDSLFQSCFEILKPGGYFFAEDFFEISPFTETVSLHLLICHLVVIHILVMMYLNRMVVIGKQRRNETRRRRNRCVFIYRNLSSALGISFSMILLYIFFFDLSV